MLYPLPAVMVSVRGKNGEDNIITVAWAGTVCTNPPMVSISVRPERYSYQMIKESGVFDSLVARVFSNAAGISSCVTTACGMCSSAHCFLMARNLSL